MLSHCRDEKSKASKRHRGRYAHDRSSHIEVENTMTSNLLIKKHLDVGKIPTDIINIPMLMP
jgi:hypothetical protein